MNDIYRGKGFPSVSAVKNLLVMQEMWVQSLGWEDSLEEEMAQHGAVVHGLQTKRPCSKPGYSIDKLRDLKQLIVPAPRFSEKI